MPIIHDGSTFTSVTHGQAEKTSLTFPTPDADSAWTDTTIDLPAYSAIEYIMIKFTTNGVISGATSAYFIANWCIHNADEGEGGGSNYGPWSSDFNSSTGIGLTNPFSAYGLGTYTVYDVPWGASYQLLYTSAKNLWVKTTTVGGAPDTAAIMDIILGYKTFGTS